MVHVSNIIIKGKSYKMLQGLADYAIFPLSSIISFHFIFSSTTKHEIIQIKNHNVVWTRLTRVGCFNWLGHSKRMRIADKNNVHCTF